MLNMKQEYEKDKETILILRRVFRIVKDAWHNPNFLKYFGYIIFALGVILCLSGVAQSITLGLSLRSDREEICKVVTMIGMGLPLIFAGINTVLKPARRYAYLIAFSIVLSLVAVAIFHAQYEGEWYRPLLRYSVSTLYTIGILSLIGILLVNIIKKESEIADLNEILKRKVEIKPDDEFFALKENLSQHVPKIAELQRAFQEFQQDFEGYGWATFTKIEELEGAHKKLIIKLLDINDDLEGAIRFIRRDKEGDKIDKDKEMVSRYIGRINNKLETALTKEGVSPIEVKVGEELYDKEGRKHEIVDVVYTDGYPEGTIVEEGRKGYYLNSKVLRASEVKTAKREKKKEG